jgi:FMN reductase
LSLVAVSAGDSAVSKTRALAAAAIEVQGGGELVDLSSLPADALLGRATDAATTAAVEAASRAGILLAATPVYRATYSGTLKAFFDRFAPNALAGTAVVLAATAIAPEHFLSLDTGMRPLIASLGGWSVPTVVYATGTDFTDGSPSDRVLDNPRTALSEAARLSAI